MIKPFTRLPRKAPKRKRQYFRHWSIFFKFRRRAFLGLFARRAAASLCYCLIVFCLFYLGYRLCRARIGARRSRLIRSRLGPTRIRWRMPRASDARVYPLEAATDCAKLFHRFVCFVLFCSADRQHPAPVSGDGGAQMERAGRVLCSRSRLGSR